MCVCSGSTLRCFVLYVRLHSLVWECGYLALVVYITWRSALMFPYIVSLYAQEHLLNECTVLILLIYSGTKNSSMHHLCSNAILMKL